MSASRTMRDAATAIWHQQRVKRLVRDRLGGGGQCLVSVRETICTDPGCEGPATEIRIMRLNFQETRALIHKPAAQVSRRDIALTFE